ncbi:MAG: MFS transporter [Legionellales bacterium]|nr:MFS transporter [Legionellales bacterium]
MNNWKTLLPLFMVIFVDVIGLCMVFPILAPLFYDPQLSILPTETSETVRSLFYGMMLTMWPLFMFISAPILGDLSDKIGRKKVLLICLFGEAISYLVGAMAVTTASLILFIISRILAGTFAGSQPIAQAAIADISTPETRTRNISYIVLASTLGVVLGPLIGGVTAENSFLSWFTASTPFQIAALIALLNAVLLIISFKETHEQKKPQKINLFKGFFLFADGFKNKKIRYLSFAFFFVQLSWSLYFQSLAYFLVKKYHFTTAHIGFFYAVLGLASVVTLTYIIRALIKILKSDNLIFAVGAALQIAGTLSAAIFTSLPWEYTALVLTSAGISLTYTVGISLYSSQVSSLHQGWIMGISAAVFGVAWAMTAITTGALSAISPILPFAAAGVFAAIGLYFIYIQNRASRNVA